MGPFEIAAIALIGAFITKIVTTRMKTDKGTVGSPKIQELEGRIQALEAQRDVQALQERVYVLEEIVTTEDFELQKKFRQLEQKKTEPLESESTG